KPFASCC
ncbi:bacterial regulatory helix-turn-helix, lysR family protein, partial [Vibrio parahaemolyticus V-223/04]